jgi:hypothetical protein
VQELRRLSSGAYEAEQVLEESERLARLAEVGESEPRAETERQQPPAQQPAEQRRAAALLRLRRRERGRSGPGEHGFVAIAPEDERLFDREFLRAERALLEQPREPLARGPALVYLRIKRRRRPGISHRRRDHRQVRRRDPLDQLVAAADGELARTHRQALGRTV